MSKINENRKAEHKKTLLLVEDEALIALDEAEMLRKHGFEVLIAYNAKEVFKALAANTVDLILMDIDLGDEKMDGTEVSEIIQEKHDLPIVFLTAHAEKEYVEKVKKISRYGYVLKNSGEFVLIEAIHMAFELFEANQKSKEKEKQYELAIYGGNLGTWDWDITTDVVTFNTIWAHMQGYKLEEIEPHIDSWKQLVHPDDLPYAMDALNAHLRGETPYYEAEFRMRHKSGRWVWIIDRGKVIEWDREGNPVRACGTHLDITERKNAEKALTESKEKLESAQKLARLGTWDWTIESDTVTWTEELYHITGRDPTKPAPQFNEDHYKIYTEESWKRLTKAVENTLKTGDTYQIEAQVVRPNGETRDVLIHGGAKYGDNHSIIGLYGTVQDITDRKRAEENFRIILHSIGDAVISTDMQGRIFQCNPVAEKLTGWDAQSAKGRYLEEIFHIINAETREKVNNPVEKVIEQGKVVGLGNHTILISKDGHEYQIADSAAPIKDESGKINGVVLVFRDVTEKYNKEKKLQEAEKLYRNLFMNAQVGLFRTDIATGRMLAANDALARFAGYKNRDDLIADNYTIAEHYLYPEDRKKLIGLLKKNGEVRNYELPFVRLDGSVMWVRFSARLSEDKKCIEGVSEDFTAEREAKENLKNALKEKEFLMQELNHRVKNNLAMISSLINLKHEELGDSPNLSDIQHQVDAIRIVHEKLFRSGEITQINLREYIGDLVHTIFRSFAERDIRVVNNVPDLHLHTRKVVPLGLIINEIATNAIKYGFRTKEKAVFKVDLIENTSKNQYVLTISNTGDPFPAEINLNKPQTLGLRLLTALVAQLEGTIELEREPSPRFIIRFPLKGSS